MIETVHVVYKTHLDLGFTDQAPTVMRKYLDHYIPGAIALANQLADRGESARFVWTTGSWLIRHYLDNVPDEQRKAMEQAIRDGHIAWHGLPCSTHTELMDESLTEYGISIARALDAEFGKRTITGKMTDVPGHTLGLVPIMARSGLKYLHIGVNTGSAVPEVPQTFVWRAPGGEEIVVNYDAAYGAARPGEALTVPGLSDALYVAHTSDNLGPPTMADVDELFVLLKQRYPRAEVKASTLDAFAERLWEVRATLPVVEEEIGDSWIHGVASDPLLVARLRELLRLRDRWLAEGTITRGTPEYDAFNDNLLLVAEHTWGADIKRFLPDFKSYSKTAFAAARERDEIEPRLAHDIHAFALQRSDEEPLDSYSYSAFERSWEDKRGYVDAALSALTPERQAEAQRSLAALTPRRSVGGTAGEGVLADHRLGRFTLRFGPDGSVVSLRDSRGRIWADEHHGLGEYRYETFGLAEYQRWIRDYCRTTEVNTAWVLADFGKVGLEYASPEPRHTVFRPSLVSVSPATGGDTEGITVRCVMPANAATDFGAPREIEVTYRLGAESDAIDIELNTFGKEANRLPEASWFSFCPKVGNPNMWRMDKMGTLVNPLEVVRNGNRSLHSVGRGLHYRGSDGQVALTTLDAPLVAPGAPRLLEFDNTFADQANGFHFNLHNNVWGTNFRMWFEEDMKYRFTLDLTQ
jgi:uncharacterized protein DUF5054/glycosyl hydrolase family 38